MEVAGMRLAGVLLSAIILLPLVSAQFYNGEPGVIAVPSINAPNMQMPTPLTTQPNMDMPNTKPMPLVKSNNPLNKTDNMSSKQTSTTQTQVQPRVKPMNVSGKLSVELDGGKGRSLELSLWSSADVSRIMGFGTLTDEGKENSVTASGSVTADELLLTTKLAMPENAGLEYDECDLDLFLASDRFSGTYFLRSSGQLTGRGNATALKP
jgi:hypothetical protein